MNFGENGELIGNGKVHLCEVRTQNLPASDPADAKMAILNSDTKKQHGKY